MEWASNTKPGMAASDRDEAPRLVRLVGDHLGVAELDAGLDDDADRAGEGGVEPLALKASRCTSTVRSAASGRVTASVSSACWAPPGVGTSVPMT